MGNPQQNLRVVHIAGSKGKGSTCAFMANILKEAGFKTGLYTSPHLVDLRERIRILQRTEYKEQRPKGVPSKSEGKPENQIISRKDFARLIEKIKPYAERLRETRLGRVSYYEILTALAFLYFEEKKVDFAVLETGIGGKLDATNVAESIVCAITPISYEHTAVLGNTLKEIAQEKAGIIKKVKGRRSKVRGQNSDFARQIVVVAPQRPSALRVIKRRARKAGAYLYEIGKDIQIKEKSALLSGQSFEIKGIFAQYRGLKIGLLGRHQITNAAVALVCAESLIFQGIRIPQEAIKKGLQKTCWPGRLQLISRRPRVLLDAAHNQASAQALKEALIKFFKFRKLILVFGVSQDKDVKGILRELVPISTRIVLTKTENPRAMAPEIIKTFIKSNARPITLAQNPIRALEIAKQSAKQRDLILVSGSLYLLGEVLKSQS